MIRGRLVSPSIKNYGKKSNSRLMQIIHYKKNRYTAGNYINHETVQPVQQKNVNV
jgi:hypothetical protein